MSTKNEVEPVGYAAMGNYSDNLAKRFSIRGPDKGSCAICGEYGTLTRDHVPPKGCGNVSDVVIRDVYGTSYKQERKPVTSQGGLHYKTLCSICNSTLLGTEYDPALISVSQAIEDYLGSAAKIGLSLPISQRFQFQPNRFIRSILGHLLAANAINDVESTVRKAPLDAVLRGFVLNPSALLDERVSVYYWLYPYRPKVIMKHCGLGFMGARGELIYGHVFKFFPFGFWVVWNESENISARRIKLPRLDKYVSIDISAKGEIQMDLFPLLASNFPEAPPDDGMWLLTDYLVARADQKKRQ